MPYVVIRFMVSDILDGWGWAFGWVRVGGVRSEKDAGSPMSIRDYVIGGDRTTQHNTQKRHTQQTQWSLRWYLEGSGCDGGISASHTLAAANETDDEQLIAAQNRPRPASVRGANQQVGYCRPLNTTVVWP